MITRCSESTISNRKALLPVLQVCLRKPTLLCLAKKVTDTDFCSVVSNRRCDVCPSHISCGMGSLKNLALENPLFTIISPTSVSPVAGGATTRAILYCPTNSCLYNTQCLTSCILLCVNFLTDIHASAKLSRLRLFVTRTATFLKTIIISR